MTNQIVYDVCKVIRADAGCPKGCEKLKAVVALTAKRKNQIQRSLFDSQ